MADGRNYTIRKGKTGDTCLVRVFNRFTYRQESRSTKIPPGLSGTKLQKFCEQCVRELEEEVQFRSQGSSPKTLFNTYFLEDWIPRKEKEGTQQSTIHDYIRWTKSIREMIGDLPLNKLTLPIIENAFDALEKQGMSANYRRRVRMVLNHSLESAKNRHIIPFSPMEGMCKIKADPRAEAESVAFTYDECQAILSAISKEPPIWRALLGLIAVTGIRREEALALRWNDFMAPTFFIEEAIARSPGGEHSYIVKEPKNAYSKRRMARTPFIALLINEWYEKCGNPPIDSFVFFSGENPDNPIYPDSVTAHVKTLSDCLGIHFTQHMLRHMFHSIIENKLHRAGTTLDRLMGHCKGGVPGKYTDSDYHEKLSLQVAYEDYLRVPSIFFGMKYVPDEDQSGAYLHGEIVYSLQNEINFSTKLVQTQSDKPIMIEKTGVSLYSD